MSGTGVVVLTGSATSQSTICHVNLCVCSRVPSYTAPETALYICCVYVHTYIHAYTHIYINIYMPYLCYLACAKLHHTWSSIIHTCIHAYMHAYRMYLWTLGTTHEAVMYCIYPWAYMYDMPDMLPPFFTPCREKPCVWCHIHVRAGHAWEHVGVRRQHLLHRRLAGWRKMEAHRRAHLDLTSGSW